MFTIKYKIHLYAPVGFITTRCYPKVLRQVVLKDYCGLHLAADTVTT